MCQFTTDCTGRENTENRRIGGTSFHSTGFVKCKITLLRTQCPEDSLTRSHHLGFGVSAKFLYYKTLLNSVPIKPELVNKTRVSDQSQCEQIT